MLNQWFCQYLSIACSQQIWCFSMMSISSELRTRTKKFVEFIRQLQARAFGSSPEAVSLPHLYAHFMNNPPPKYSKPTVPTAVNPIRIELLTTSISFRTGEGKTSGYVAAMRLVSYCAQLQILQSRETAYSRWNSCLVFSTLLRAKRSSMSPLSRLEKSLLREGRKQATLGSLIAYITHQYKQPWFPTFKLMKIGDGRMHVHLCQFSQNQRSSALGVLGSG